ncbi:hypothetical protein ACSVDM_21500 [Nocardia sp. JW2]|uniref:hypothetical protein n=1 Tax=Nocardia sp. JW2 TaxID=3450738 RepID=UPI003F442EA9
MQPTLQPASPSTGERIHPDIELELLPHQRRRRPGGSDLGRNIGGQLGTGTGDRLGRQLAHPVGQPLPDTVELVPEPTTDGPTDRTTESRQTQVGPTELVHRPVALGHLDRTGKSIDAALFERLERRPTQCRPRRRFGNTTRDHPGQQRFHRHLHRDLRGDARGHTGDRADTGPRSGKGQTDFHGSDDHRADDHQLGVFDVVGAVVEQFGLLLAPLGDRGERGLVAGEEFVAVGGDRVVGLARRQRGQGRIQCLGRILVDGVEGVGGRGPGIGEATHSRFVTVGPIARAENVFRDPLERIGDFDTHELAPRHLIQLGRVRGVLGDEGVGDRHHVGAELGHGLREIVDGSFALLHAGCVVLRERLPDLVPTPALTLGGQGGGQRGEGGRDRRCHRVERGLRAA